MSATASDKDETQPPATNDVENVTESTRATCCFKLIVQHTLREAGESKWAPRVLLVFTRAGTGFVLLTMGGIAFLQTAVTRDSLLFSITYNGLATTFFALALCTHLTCCCPAGAGGNTFATIIVLAHALFGTLAVFLLTDLAYSTVVFGINEWVAGVLVLPFCAYLSDVVIMQARVRLRFRYILSVTCVYLGYAIVTTAGRLTNASCLPTAVTPCTRAYPGRQVGIQLIFLALLPFCAAVAIGLTRIPWPCYGRRSQRS